MHEYGIPIGVESLHFAPLVQDDETGAVYDEPFKLCEVISIKPAFEFAEGGLDADNKRIREDAELTGIKYQINASALKPAIYAKITGHRIDANGGIVTKDGDMPPEGALLYKRTLDNGKSKYVVVYKGVFREPSDEAETRKKGQKNYQTPTVEYSAYRRVDGLMRYELSEEMQGYSTEAVMNWFKAVPEPVVATWPDPVA